MYRLVKYYQIQPLYGNYVYVIFLTKVFFH